MKNPCKDCSESIEVAPDQIEEIVRHLVKTRNMKLVDSDTGKHRLSLCMSCTAYMQEGGTCKYCGCLVEVKTRMEGARCPFPSNPKW